MGKKDRRQRNRDDPRSWGVSKESLVLLVIKLASIYDEFFSLGVV